MRRLSCLLVLLASACGYDTSLPAQAVRGRIYGWLDNSAGKQPNDGWPVTLSSDKGVMLSEVTQGDGGFLFADLPPGVYLASAKPDGYARVTSDLLSVLDGMDTDAGVLRPDSLSSGQSNGIVLGRVTTDQGDNVDGTKVDFLQNDISIDQLVLADSDDGGFSKGLPEGTYQLRATHPYFVASPPLTVNIASGITNDITATPLVMMRNPATLTGTVMMVSDAPTAPAVGANVTLEDGQSTTVDATGNFILGSLAGGPHTVTVTLPGYHDSVASHAVMLTPLMSTALEPVTLLVNRGSITGKIQLGDGAAVSGALAEVSGTGKAGAVASEAMDPSTGDFTITDVPVGTWTVTGNKPQYSISSATAVVVYNQQVDVGTLKLSRLLGDFQIDDADPSNTPGYTRTLGVTLNFTGFPTTGVTGYRASEDSTFDGGTFLPYTGPLQAFTLSAGDGPHTVYAQYEAGTQVSQAFSSTVVLDTVPPTVTSVTFSATGISGTTKYTSQNLHIPLTLVATDSVGGSAVSKMRVGTALDGMGNVSAPGVNFAVSSTTFDVTPAADGLETIDVQVLDNAGNASAVATDSIIVDTTPPTGSLTIATGAKATDPGYTNNALVTLNEAWSDGDGGIVLVKLANTLADLDTAVYQPTSTTAGWFLDPLGEGTKTVYAIFRDVAGNTAMNMQSANITYDITAPTPAVITLAGAPVTKNPMVVVNLNTNTADLSTMQALTLSDESTFTSSTKIGPSPYPGTAQATYTLSAGDGVRSIYARFRDKAGNDAVTSVSLTLDTVPPQGSFSLTGTLADGTPSSTLTATNSVTLSLVPGGAIEYHLGDATMITCPTGVYTTITTNTVTNQTLPAGGTMTLCFRDAAGNTQGPLSQTLTFDNTPPAGCTIALAGLRADGVTAAPAGLTAKAVVTATVSGCNAGTVELYLVNGTALCSPTLSASWTGFSSPSTASSFLLAGEGSNTVSGCARDAARNVSSIPAVAMTLDTTPPAALNVVINGGAPYLNAAGQTGGLDIVSVLGQATGATEWAISETTPSVFSAFSGAAQSFTFSGDGSHTIYAVFRDAVWNQSAVVSDAITVDTTAPVGGTISLLSPTSNTFINSNFITVNATAPSDATGVQLAEDLAPPGCTAADFAAAATSSIASTYSLVISSSQGSKTLCARWLDAAQNVSLTASDTKTLDSIAPPQPTILSPERTFNPTVGGESLAQLVQLLNQPDPQHLDWQVLGGTTTMWTSVDAGTQLPPQPLGAPFTLIINATARNGVPNILRVRERDQAGNASGEASIVLTSDVVSPAPVTMNTFWTDNASNAGVVRWQPSSDTDVTGYEVFYGAASGNPGGLSDGGSMNADGGNLFSDGGFILPQAYNGFYATQGGSPITVGNQAYASLSGLTNGSVTYVTVRPIDHAGNVGAAPTAQPREVSVQPNVISPNLLMDIPTVRDAGPIPTPDTGQVVVMGNYAYVRESAPSFCETVLYAVDLSTIVSPIQSGSIQPTPPSLQIYPSTVLSDGTCPSFESGDMVGDYPYLFTVHGNHFRVWTVANPKAPAVIADLDLSISFTNPELTSVDVRGSNAFVIGNSVFAWIDVSTLYDHNPATRPSWPASDKFSLSTGDGFSSAIGWTRDRLFYTPVTAVGNAWDVSGAVDFSTGTTMTSSNEFANAAPNFATNHNHMLNSGNLLITSETSGLAVYSLGLMLSKTSPYSTVVAGLGAGLKGQYEISGPQVFANDSSASGLTTFDLSSYQSAIVATGTTRAATAVNSYGLALYGPYAIQSNETGPSLRVYEVATPRSMHVVDSVLGVAAGRPTPINGFVVAGSGMVLDEMAGGSANVVQTSDVTFGCTDDAAVFDDTLITSNDYTGQLHITPLDAAEARPTTPSNASSVSTTVSLLPATSYVRGVERVGNYAIFATVRSTTPTGLWLEVYRASGLRSTLENGLRSFTPGATAGVGDKVAEMQIATSGLGATSPRPLVRVTNGIAAVVDPNSATVWVVDIHAMLDDTGGAGVLLGTVTGFTGNVHDAVVAGHYLYVAGVINASNVQGLHIYDLSAGFALVSSTPVPYASGVDVRGAYAVVASYNVNAGGLTSFDVSTPALPKPIGYMPLAYGNLNVNCSIRQGLVLSGSRAYVGTYERLDVVELE